MRKIKSIACNFIASSPRERFDSFIEFWRVHSFAVRKFAVHMRWAANDGNLIWNGPSSFIRWHSLRACAHVVSNSNFQMLYIFRRRSFLSVDIYFSRPVSPIMCCLLRIFLFRKISGISAATAAGVFRFFFRLRICCRQFSAIVFAQSIWACVASQSLLVRFGNTLPYNARRSFVVFIKMKTFQFKR